MRLTEMTMAKKVKTAYKMYEVRHYVRARNIVEARRIVKKKETEPDEIWINADWKKGENTHLAEAIGFEQTPDEEEEVPEEYQ